MTPPEPESDYANEKRHFDSVSNKSSDIHSTIGTYGLHCNKYSDIQSTIGTCVLPSYNMSSDIHHTLTSPSSIGQP